MSVLLIGSTGMGKSTFGNFLFDPNEEHMFDKQTFTSATDNKPMTQEVKVVTRAVDIEGGRNVLTRSMWLRIIDTPGLNESAEKDLSHMMQIIKNLNERGEIRACILVVKFNAKIDAQYKATLEYYSKLLPGLFDKNVIIVMTDFATDERSETQRKRLRIDVEQVKRNTILELGKCSNKQLTYSPQLFTIDSLPMASAEMETSLTVRSAILDFIFQLTPIKVRNLMVAKTDCIKQKDAQEYEKLNGEITGYNSRLKEVHTDSKKVLDDTRQKELEITEIESTIHNLETNLQDKDKTEDVVAEHWSIEEGWKLFRWFTREFNVESPHERTNYATWTNGKCEFIEIVKTSRAVRGKVEGRFIRGIYASVTVYTEKKKKYADDIEHLKKQLVIKNTNLTRCKAEWEGFRKEHAEKLEEIKLLQDYIDERRVAATKCRSDYMTMEDAMSMLEELQK